MRMHKPKRHKVTIQLVDGCLPDGTFVCDPKLSAEDATRFVEDTHRKVGKVVWGPKGLACAIPIPGHSYMVYRVGRSWANACVGGTNSAEALAAAMDVISHLEDNP